MIVFGGYNLAYQNTGARYNPTTNTWTAITTSGAPSARHYHTAVWSGTEMIIWGGSSGSTALSDGARYNPTGNTWTAIRYGERTRCALSAHGGMDRFGHGCMGRLWHR